MDELVTSLLNRGLHSACSGLHGEIQTIGCGRIETELISAVVFVKEYLLRSCYN